LDSRFANEGAVGCGRSPQGRETPEVSDPDRYAMGRMNPDIVMVEERSAGDCRGTIHGIEVGYCWDHHWATKQDEKANAHKEVVKALRKV
jgi:hypothetical protein